MKILLLADPASTHTLKWVTALSGKGLQIFLFGLNSVDTELYDHPNIKLYSFNLSKMIRFNSSKTSLSKLIYLKALIQIKSLIKEIKPDILHAHYASSYGLLGALSGFQPYIISVWGSDVLTFPKISVLHKKLLKFSLSKANIILATSKYLAKETANYTNKTIQNTPFGVDLTKFKYSNSRELFNEADIVIGTIKSLEKIYGIDTLIKAFSIVKKKHENIPLKLLIVGNGSEEKVLKKLAGEIYGGKDIIFKDFVNHDIIHKYHNMIDIPVYLSHQESFGVAVIEAMACCKPVIVSSVGGFKEIVTDGQEGFIVPPSDVDAAAEAISKLIINTKLRRIFGYNGRKKVEKLYDWEKCVDKMIQIYEETIKLS